jgi:hypothetical protein
MGNRVDIFKAKFKLGMIKLLGLSSYVDSIVEDKDCEIRMAKRNLEQLQKKYEYVADEFGYYKQKALATISEKVHLDYDKISGDYPILIVKANDSTPLNQDMFTRIRYHINQVCPNIKLIMFLKEGMKVEELDDDNLRQAGLRRITNE